MRRPRHKLQVSTFPFLAVLLGAMGALILLLLVMDRRSKIVARNRAFEAHKAEVAAAQDKAKKAFDHSAEAEEARRAEWERKRAELHALLRDQEKKLKDERAALDTKANALGQDVAQEKQALADLEKRLMDERARLDVKSQLLAQMRQGIARTVAQDAASKQRVEELARELAQLERVLQEVKAVKAQEQETYSLVPYHGKRGEGRQPVYVECTGSGLVFHPEHRRLDNPDFDIQVFRNEVKQRGIDLIRPKTDGEEPHRPPVAQVKTNPYVLFLVRPDGLESYYNATGALRGFDLDFGYEFIDAAWVLDFSKGMDSYKTALPAHPSPPPPPLARERLHFPVFGAGDAMSAGAPALPPGAAPGSNGPGLPGGYARGTNNAASPPLPPGAPGELVAPGNGNPGTAPLQDPRSAGGQLVGGVGAGQGAGGPRVEGGTGIPVFRPQTGGQQGGAYMAARGTQGAPGTGTGPFPGPGSQGNGGNGTIGVSQGANQPYAGRGLAVPTGEPGGPYVASLNGPGNGPRSGTGSAGTGPFAGPGSPGSGMSGPGSSEPQRAGYEPGNGPTQTGGVPGSFSGSPNVPGNRTGNANTAASSGGAGGPAGGTVAANATGGTSSGGPSNGQTGQTGTGPGNTIASAPAGGTGSGQSGQPNNGSANKAGSTPNLETSGGGQPGQQPGNPEDIAWRGSGAPGSPNAGRPGATGSPQHGGGTPGDNRGSDGDGTVDPLARLAPNTPFADPRPGPKKATPAPTLGRLLANRDYVLTIECFSDAVAVYPSRQVFNVAYAADQSNIDAAMVQAVKQLIARRQATVRTGEVPYRPLLRFQVHPGALRTYFHVYPLFESLHIPMSRENLDS